MRKRYLITVCVVAAGCIQGASTDPDGIGMGPIPEPGSLRAGDPSVVVQADKAELNCLLQEVQIAIAQAPADGRVTFNGLNTCKITPDR